MLKVYDIMIGLNEGKTLKMLCEEFNVDLRNTQKKLNRLGYKYDPNDKIWIWEGNGIEPLDINLYEEKREVNMEHEKAEQMTLEIMEQSIEPILLLEQEKNKTISSNVSQLIFLELKKIRELINDKKNMETQEEDLLLLFKNIMFIPKEEKVRKTIVINKSIGSKLDNIALKSKIDKSDIIHIALMDFFSKYYDLLNKERTNF